VDESLTRKVGPLSTSATKKPRTHLLDRLRAEVAELQASGRAVSRMAPAYAPPISPIPAPKRKRRRRHRNMGTPVTVALGLTLILVAAYLAISYVQTELRNQKWTIYLQTAGSDIILLDESLATAKALHSEKKLRKAKDRYTEASMTARDILEKLEAAQLVVKGVDLTHTTTLIEKTRASLGLCLTALGSPEIKHGGEGKVFYEGEWRTPKEKDETYAKKMAAKGFILMEGKWVSPESYAAKHNLVWVNEKKLMMTPTEYAAWLKSEAKKNPTPPVTPDKPKPDVAPVKPADPFDPTLPRWVLDDFEDNTRRWRSATWGNPCALTIMNDADGKRLKAVFSPGKRDKYAISRRLNLNFSSRSSIVMDVYNNSKSSLPMALAITTNEFYESRVVVLRPGVTNRVVFKLRTSDFKAASTSWSHRAKVNWSRKVSSICFLIYHDGAGEIVIDNIAAQGSTK
jgi:hypothetical protein